jgi:hypothetical protein
LAALNESEAEKAEFLFEYAERTGEAKPEPPEAYLFLLRLKKYELTIYSGGYMNQPYFTLREFDACLEGESEFKQLQSINLALKTEGLKSEIK